MPSIPRLHRRNFMGLSLLGLGASCRQTTGAAPVRAKAQRVLVVFEQGGLSHMDTWDPKPDATVEHRSPFAPIATRVSGVRFTSLLTQTAPLADRLAVVRCMTQPKAGVGNSHPKGSQYIFSGESPGGPDEMPDISSVVSYRMGSKARHLPSNMLVPGTSEQAGESRLGFLPPQHKVFRTGGSPALPGWTVPNLSLSGIDPARFGRRASLLEDLDVGIVAPQAADARALASLREQAEDMLTNQATRHAFDLMAEPEKVRDRYGPGHRGACYLIGRKLLEAGVRFVTVDCREPASAQYPKGGNMNWDHHDFIYSNGSTEIAGGGAGAGRYGIGTWPMMGSVDRAFSALIEDLGDRGMLADTLVCFVSEFGRTPRLNKVKGRDHWTHAFSFVFAGAGVRGGQVIGQTDRDGGYVTSPMAYTIEDYAATIYEKLGIDRNDPLITPAGRPIYMAREGKPIPELF